MVHYLNMFCTWPFYLFGRGYKMAANSLKILLVEDDADIREVITLVLGLEGYEVTGLENGHDVVDQVHDNRPDVVLMDAMLGDMDGRDICQVLKNDPTTEAIPVMIVSASHGFFDSDRPSYGANDYLAKPFDIHELISRVKKLIAA